MTMRQRSTWSKPGEAPRQAAAQRSAATERRADIYTMNQEHPQPGATEYESGDPDSWAETPVPGEKMTVKDEYEGDHVKRNEVGFGEFRDDTYKHKDSDKWHGPGKYDNSKVSAERKAKAAERVARAVLRTSNEKLVEETTLALMALPAPALASTLRNMDAVSPEALPEEARYKRAYACAKLAARMLGEAATEKHVTDLGSIIAGLDDPTLKSILRTIASARVAQQQEQQEEEGAHTSQQEEQEEEEQAPVAQQQQQQQEQQGQQQEQAQQELMSQQEEQAHGLCPEDALLLDQMMKAEMQEHAAPPVPGAGGADELQALFPPAAPAMGAPMMAAAPQTAGTAMPEISFEDDDAGETAAFNAATAAGGGAAGSLEDLFSDHPEVQAQREIQAANQEQAAREGGYGAAGRTASSRGAKKLGAVQGGKPLSVDATLENIWDRP